MYSTPSDPTLIRALCCDCGQVRTFKRGYYPRRFVGDFGSGFLMSHEGRRLFPFAQPWDRCVGDLKCRPCGAVTRHAILRDGDEFADFAEEKNYGTVKKL